MSKPKGTKRFSFHWNKKERMASVHFDGKCHLVHDIDCLVPCESKVNNRQPYFVMQGWAERVSVTVGLGGYLLATIS